MSMEREAVLQRLLRSITLSIGDFALLLARCNSIEVRDRLVVDLQAQLGDRLYDRHVTEADRVLNLVDILDEVPEETEVISITGLEASPHLHDILALANNAREEFRKRFKCPLVLWVTDEVEAQIRRRSPDLASWAAPSFNFGLELDELQAMLERETADVLNWAFAREGKRGIGQELQWAWQEWQSFGENRSPELAAKVELVFGIEAGSGEAARSHFENCLAQVSTGSLAAAARYRLGLWWQLRGKQNRVEFIACCDRAREQLQMAWQEDKQASVALALGEILLALALPENGNATQWQALASFTQELVILPDWAAGLRAEVAIARRDWQVAKAEADQALQGPERRGFYLLSLGRSLIGMERAKEAIAPLAEARTLVAPAVDPDLHIRILQALHQAHTAVGNYREAFSVKCDREAVETSYGFRAFIGAGRLQPQRRVGAIGEEATEEIAASGRQADIEALVDRVKRPDCRLTVVHGPSGVGKSSLLQSGLVPALRKVIHESRSVNPVVIEQYEDWQGELGNKLGRSPLAPLFKGGKEGKEILEVPLLKGDLGGSDQLIAQLHEYDRQNLITVLIFDQFEEFFFKHTEVPDRRKLYDFLRECLAVPYVWVILALREDYIHYLLECDRLANIEMINNDILNKNVRYYLGNFSKERAKAVINELTERSPYRLESALVDRLVADLAAEFGEVRPIELQVVGAQMLHGEVKITTLGAYEALGHQPKRALVERWLTQVVRDCGEENEELAQRVLFALTEEPEKRPAKTKTELQREVRLLTPELAPEEVDLAVRGDLDFVLQVPIGAGLAFEIPASPEVCYQLVHDYLVQPIRRQFGGKLEKQLEEERQKRKQAEQRAEQVLQEKLEESRRNNRRLTKVLISTAAAAVVAVMAGGLAIWQKTIADDTARDAKTTADTLVWNGLLNAEASTLEDQVEAIEKVKTGTAKPEILRSNYRRPVGILRPAANVFREKQTFQGHQNAVSSVAFAPDGKSLLTGSLDKTAKLWSFDGKLLQTFSGHQNAVSSVAFAPDGQSLLTGSYDKTAKLWSLDGKLLQTFQGHQDSVYSVAFAPDGQSVLTGSLDNTAKLWSLDGKLLQTFSGHQNAVSSVAFAPDGQSVLTGSRDKTAKLWSLDGKLLQTFQGHQNYVSSVAFAPVRAAFPQEVGQSLLTGSWDNTAKLWSLDGKLLQTFSGHQDYVSSVAFAPDGQSVLTGSYDKTAQVWNIDLDFSLARSCNYLQDFIALSNDPSLPKADRTLRQRAKTACEGIPPPKPF